MKKYIIIETWNGEGYSDSMAQVVRYVLDGLEGFQEAQKHCMSEVLECIGLSNAYTIHKDINLASISYSIKEDSGCYSWCEFTGQYGVVLHPMTNSFSILENYSDYKFYVTSLLANSTEYDEDEIEALETEQTDNICFSGVEGDAILVKL